MPKVKPKAKVCNDKDFIIEKIKEAESFIVIFNYDSGDAISHITHEMENREVISACECVKHNYLNTVTKAVKKK